MTPSIVRKKMLKRRQRKHFRHKMKQMKLVLMKFDWNIVMCWKCDRGCFLKEAIKREGNGAVIEIHPSSA